MKEQNAKLWSRDMIIEAEGLLTRASRFGQFGRFQCEAAIQSVHVQRPISGSINHAALTTLYAALAAHYPGLGVRVGQAAVYLDAGEPLKALAALDAIPRNRIAAYQPYWAARAAILAAMGRTHDARAAAETAICLTKDETIRAYLRESASRWAG